MEEYVSLESFRDLQNEVDDLKREITEIKKYLPKHYSIYRNTLIEICCGKKRLGNIQSDKDKELLWKHIDTLDSGGFQDMPTYVWHYYITFDENNNVKLNQEQFDFYAERKTKNI